MSQIVIRCGIIAGALFLWFWSQKMISLRPMGSAIIGDKIHELTAGVNSRLLRSEKKHNLLLILSSALIDCLGIFILASSIFGPTIRPFIGLFLLFTLRQLSQALTALPTPNGMIWKYPGFPSLLVTYGTANDLFFSGHTAIAVYGAIELARLDILPLTILGILIAVFEAATVLVLRAHWTMDVFTGAITALWIAELTPKFAPFIDKFLG